MATPFTMTITKIRCLVETDEVGSDEPYVLVFVADLSKKAGGVIVPSAATTRYGPWHNVDKNDLLPTIPPEFGPSIPGVPGQVNFWGLNEKAKAVQSPEDIIILMALIENDNGKPSGVRTGLHAILFAALASYINGDMNYQTIVKKLKKDMQDTLKGPLTIGVLNNDDLIAVQEVRLQQADLQALKHGTRVKNIMFNGDGGSYRVRVEMRPA
jgi:hypothetical protein